jgi:hypothetical protein
MNHFKVVYQRTSQKIMQSKFVRKVSSICIYVRFEVPLVVNI